MLLGLLEFIVVIQDFLETNDFVHMRKKSKRNHELLAAFADQLFKTKS